MTITNDLAKFALEASALNLAGFQRNRIFNGDMRIDQRHNGASVTATSGAAYIIDRWGAFSSVASKFTVQQNGVAAVTGDTFTNMLYMTSSGAYVPAAGETFFLYQNIEGFTVSDLGWGTASAKPVTLSFWVYPTVGGTHTVALLNSTGNRSYVATYTATGSTWNHVTLTIPGDTAGTWLTTNGIGIQLRWNLGSGSTWQAASANAWGTVNAAAVAGAASTVGTSGAIFAITGVQLEGGSTATPFERRPYAVELALCQRYYFASGSYQLGGYQAAGGVNQGQISFPVPMRATPTITFPAPSYANASGLASWAGTNNDHVSWNVTVTATGNGYAQALFVADAEL